MKQERSIDYVYQMRKAFSNKKSIFQNGELNHKYFQTKIGCYWTHAEDENLFSGIEVFGVGAWDEIKNKFLKNWSETEIKLRCGSLLQCFNVEKYNTLKLTKEEIEEIANKNETEGKEKNKFKYGIYFN